MHLAEGVLSAPVLIGGGALTGCGLWMGVRRLHEEHLVHAATCTSAFFVASLIHVPFGPSSAHLLLIGLVGVMLGWVAFPCIFVGLLLQAVLFQFGGLTTLGVNTSIMAAPAVCVHYLFGAFIRRGGAAGTAASFLAGGGAILGAALLAAAALFFTDDGFVTLAALIIGVHLPVMFVEGVVAASAAPFLARVHPALISGAEYNAARTPMEKNGCQE